MDRRPVHGRMNRQGFDEAVLDCCSTVVRPSSLVAREKSPADDQTVVPPLTKLRSSGFTLPLFAIRFFKIVPPSWAVET